MRPSTTFRRLLGFPLALLLALAAPIALAAQSVPDALTLFRDRLAAQAPGVWITSNESYMEEDGGTEEYGLDWELLPGGNASRGCLWGVADGVSTVYWEFSVYWNPLEEQGVIYQTGPSRAIGIGIMDPRRPESEMMVQTVVQPNGARFEIGHTADLEGDDVRIDHSFQRAIGASEWTAGRTYRWERRQGVAVPCWG